MKPIEQLRKEKSVLSSYASRCRYYISMLSLKEIDEQRIILKEHKEPNQELSYEYDEGEGYYNEPSENEKNIAVYESLIQDYEDKIRIIDEEIKARKSKSGILSMAVVLFLFASLFILYNPDITGKVTFSLVESDSNILNIELNESANLSFLPDLTGSIDTISLSGRYSGEGSLRIYLDSDSESRLVYAVENSSGFESVCGSACYLQGIKAKNYTLRVEMPKTASLNISRIDYFIAEIKEFKIAPNNITVDLTENRFIRHKFGIYNTLGSNFSIAIYAEGELTKYTTLYSSIETFSDNDSVKYVNYDIDLPFNILSGTYREKIVVRYLPSGEFKGEAPKEEHEVIVNVMPEGDNAEKKSPVNYSLAIMIGLLVFIAGVNVFFFLRNKK